MARKSQDREDLLRDATAFTTRVQLQVSWGDRSEEVFVGFRVGGAASFYFDQDPVYHFNATGQLRRVYVDDTLVKAVTGRLVRLTRQRSSNESALIRHDMTTDEQHAFCQTVRQRLRKLLQVIVEGMYVMDGQVLENANENVIKRLSEFIEQQDKIAIADSPRVAG